MQSPIAKIGCPAHGPSARPRSHAAPTRSRKPLILLTLIALQAVGLAGCRTTAKAVPTEPPPQGNALFMNWVSEQPEVTADAAYRAVWLLWKGEPYEGDFAALSAELEQANIVPTIWNLEPDHLVDRAAVGVMVCRVCDIRTGLNWRLSGLGRYAWRELQRLGIAGPGSEWQHPSGGEFVGILTRAEEYLVDAGRASQVDLDAPPQ